MTAVLDSLELTPATSLPGLVSVSSLTLPDRVDEQYTVRQAAAIGGIDYMFFRRFSDGRSSQAAAFVVDNSGDRLNEVDLAEIHRKVWLSGASPLLYVGWQTRVDILACSRGPDFWEHSRARYVPADTIEIAADVSFALQGKLHRYSARRLSDGTFWDNPENAPLAESGRAAHRQLIRAVIEADKDIEGDKSPTLRRLLLLTVLIKYLEDRGVFPDFWFAQFHEGASSFFELLQKASPEKIRALLAELEKRFNGDVFELPEGNEVLTRHELDRFAELVEARTLRAQRYLWDQYSFRYIPVEVLSHLYQHFAQKGKGAFFTPPFLASLMLDYVMPYDRLTGDESILDPTCGSGVFLVGAFRRLVHFWQSRNAWEQPQVDTLQKILTASIFGIELQEEAVHLTCFSLALAVCDALQPNVIWDDLRFDKLIGQNLFVSDFADWLSTGPGKSLKFTVIVGNPPFISKLTQAALVHRKAQGRRYGVPDKQMAYFVAEQAPSLLTDEGRLCLLQPHGFLYNQKVRRFQKKIFAEHQVEAILDFTSIRKLFDGADPKTIALVLTKREPAGGHRLAHLTFRRTFSVKERIVFELDHYDRHLIPQRVSELHSWIWRVDLLGGGRLRHLAARLDAMPKLIDFIEAKHWEYGEGFVAGASGTLEPASWLTGRPFLPTRAFDENGIDRSAVQTVTSQKFRSPYTEARYSAPLVLIKKLETLPTALWTDGFLAYQHRIVGIHAPQEEEQDLRDFHARFISNQEILEACCSIFGTENLSSKATSILKRDIDVLPWPTDGKQWALSWWERVLCEDLVEHSREFIRLGQNSRALSQQVTKPDLGKYADVFVRMLGTVYPNLVSAESGLLDGLAFQAFCFGEAPEIDWISKSMKHLKDICYQEHGDALRTVRILRFYERNTIVIIKPDRLRHWIRSTGIRDADETLVDLQAQGY